MISDKFNSDIRPLLDQLPVEYKIVIREAILTASGHSVAAPEIDVCMDEAKNLLLYLLEKPCTDGEESVTSNTSKGGEHEIRDVDRPSRKMGA